MTAFGRFPSFALQHGCTVQRTAGPDPLLPFRTLASLPLIDLTADIRREGRGGSR